MARRKRTEIPDRGIALLSAPEPDLVERKQRFPDSGPGSYYRGCGSQAVEEKEPGIGRDYLTPAPFGALPDFGLVLLKNILFLQPLTRVGEVPEWPKGTVC